MIDEQIREKSKKRQEYSKVVKKEHWPNISMEKQQEMYDIRMKLNKKNTRNSVKVFDTRKSSSMLNNEINQDLNNKTLISNKTHIHKYNRYQPKSNKKSQKTMYDEFNNSHSQRIGSKLNKK